MAQKDLTMKSEEQSTQQSNSNSSSIGEQSQHLQYSAHVGCAVTTPPPLYEKKSRDLERELDSRHSLSPLAQLVS